MAKKKALASPFEGRWSIESMSAWDEDFLHEEEPAYIEFTKGQGGQFHFGNVCGNLDCREGLRDGKPAVEFSWDGNAEMDAACGRGWAIRIGDELHGMLFFHQGDDSEFVAKKD